MLDSFSILQVFLGNYPYQRFTEEKIQKQILQFQKKLAQISLEIKERNKGLDVPYTYLLPERVPNSITI